MGEDYHTNRQIKEKNTDLVPLRPEMPVEESKLKKLTDEDIIRGFKYLINKDRKDD